VGRRLEARVRGQIWHLYCADAGLIDVMTRLEARIDKGFLRLKDEVGLRRLCLVAVHRRSAALQSCAISCFFMSHIMDETALPLQHRQVHCL
jgi:hypothetical protein